MGDEIRIPFHVTAVCDGEVPRKVRVETDARPYDFIYPDEPNVRTSAMLCAGDVRSMAESIRVTSAPISRRERAVAVIPRRATGASAVADRAASAPAVANHNLYFIISSRMRGGIRLR